MKQWTRIRQWTRRTLLPCLLAAALILPMLPAPALAADADSTAARLTVTYGQTDARRMLDMINEFRTGDEANYWNSTDTSLVDAKGDPLTYSGDLEEIAMQRAAEIALSFAHTRTDGESCFTAVSTDGIKSFGENIAAGSATAERAFQQWREDDAPYVGQGHRRNMLGLSFKAVGIGHAEVNGTHYWVQEFGYAEDPDALPDPVDGERAVPLTIAHSLLENASLSLSADSVQVEAGRTAELPAVTASVQVQEAWPARATSLTVLPVWTSRDTGVITVEDQTVTGQEAGSTTLVGAALGQTVSLSATVGDDPNASGGSADAVGKGTCGDGVEWVFDSAGVLTISGQGAMGYNGSAPWHEYRDSIKTVIVEDGVTAIADSAFDYDYPNITRVEIRGALDRIGARAFYLTRKLLKVFFYDAAPAEVGSDAFNFAGYDIGYSSSSTGPTGTVTFYTGPFSLYYVAGKSGWTSPGWNGYRTTVFVPGVDDLPEPEAAQEAVTSLTNADGTLNSGLVTMPKLTEVEITRLLEDHPNTGTPSAADDLFDVTPVVNAPYAAGKTKRDLLLRTTERLSALRNIAGLTSVTLDDEMSDNAQYGAVILAHIGSLSHTPAQPSDMDNDFYDRAYHATSTSNIAAGSALLTTPDAFMDDSDGSNVDRVGHRRWQLNPSMGKTGFGYALAENDSYGRYTVEKAHDNSVVPADYAFISWPASGLFPASLMNIYGYSDTAWSVSLNPERYSTPSLPEIRVTMTRESDGKTWSFQGGASYVQGNQGLYLNVETSGFGVDNCIIFRPDGVETYEGVYTVTIEGLKDREENPVNFSYRTEFFDPAGVEVPDTTEITGLASKTGTDGALTVTVTARSTAEGDYTLIAAAYDKDGKLLAVLPKTAALSRTASETVFDLDGCQSAERVKAFVLKEDKPAGPSVEKKAGDESAALQSVERRAATGEPVPVTVPRPRLP